MAAPSYPATPTRCGKHSRSDARPKRGQKKDGRKRESANHKGKAKNREMLIRGEKKQAIISTT
jgi:hypothetical protein